MDLIQRSRELADFIGTRYGAIHDTITMPVEILAVLRAVHHETRIEALREALSVMVRFSPDTGPSPTLMERVLRGMIEKETADGP